MVSKLSLVLLVAMAAIVVEAGPAREAAATFGPELSADLVVVGLVEDTEEKFRKMYDEEYTSLEPVSYREWALKDNSGATVYYIKATVTKKDGTKSTVWLRIYRSSREAGDSGKPIRVLTSIKTNVTDAMKLNIF